MTELTETDLPVHPDPHAWTWTDAEKRAILRWGNELRATQADAPEADKDAILAAALQQVDEYARIINELRAMVDAPEAGQEAAAVQAVGAAKTWRELLRESEANFNRQFGISVSAAWVYRDLEDLFAALHDKRCSAALNMSDPCNCGATS